ncbi:hypothetical protein [Sedimentitalea todarodis]|uniref:Uncharacterized protein n=1 Tax=Sedimentitalea todarodis TaxID=1631240 RepID=A0ABU3VH90_9RHOB|nr:hypothetical protein [Sedimentitalea todarodis]MDU9005458.1 hypothetical protein [Sedimentitalea todarodis]
MTQTANYAAFAISTALISVSALAADRIAGRVEVGGGRFPGRG